MEMLAILRAIRSGAMSEAEALERHGLSPEDIAVWGRTVDSLTIHRR